MPERQRRSKSTRNPVLPGRGERVLVIGLGRFGSAVAHELMSLGSEVLGIDASARAVQDHAELLTHVVEADTTDRAVLAQLGVSDFDRAVVGIGTDTEASLLTTAALIDSGISNVWAKPVTSAHGQILERVGAHHVVYPERDMGRHVAHLVSGGVLDWFQLDESFAMAETTVPAELVGQSLADAGIRAPLRGDRRERQARRRAVHTYATPDTVLAAGDILVVAGERTASESVAHISG